MMSFSGCYDDQDANEDEELEMYGLRNDDDEDSDDERQAIEQAMFMRIHYGVAAEEKIDAPKSTSDDDDITQTSNNVKNTIARSRSREKTQDSNLLEDSNKIVNDDNPASPVDNTVLKEARIDSDIGQKKSRYDIIKDKNKRNALNSLNDSGVIITDKKNDDSDSKYSVKKRDVGSTSSDYFDNSVITLDTTDEYNITLNVSSSDSDSDVCVIQNPSKQPPVFIDLSDSPAKQMEETEPATSLVVKIKRDSSMAESTTVSNDPPSAKQRMWKGRGGLPSQNRTNHSIFEVSSDSIRKALHGNKRRGSSKDSSSDSESDCMLVESMSEDENMDFNFVTPLGMERSKVTAADGETEKDEDSASSSRFGQTIGLGSRGPQCHNCKKFGHTARYCPEPKSDDLIKSKSGRYFQPETEQSDSTDNSNQNKNFKCLNCHEMGHLVRNCPEPKRIPTCVLCGEKGHFDLVCPDALCFKCNLPGHRAKECQRRKLVKYVWCHRCQLQGHDTEMCPDSWRQYHLTMEPDKQVRFHNKNYRSKAKLYCCNCGVKGHHAFDCLGERMDAHTTAVFPHVWCYDDQFQLPGDESGPSKINILSFPDSNETKNKGRNRRRKSKFKNPPNPVGNVLNIPIVNLRTVMSGNKKNARMLQPMTIKPPPNEELKGLTKKDAKKLRWKFRQLRRKVKAAEAATMVDTEGLSNSEVRALQIDMENRVNAAKRLESRIADELKAKKEGRYEEYLKERNNFRTRKMKNDAEFHAKVAARRKAKKERKAAEKAAKKRWLKKGEFV